MAGTPLGSGARFHPRGVRCYPLDPGATLVALAHTAHLGELTAVLVTDERRGFAKALEVAKAILEYRPMAFRYGLHQVSGALPQTR